ncbi:MAG TPA: flagellar basal body-associated FliL family protein [Steroidobacteraceae bacterium]|nr:flagellar basal body-associated FliL family protein [Steroidobacteraceae bacterium]
MADIPTLEPATDVALADEAGPRKRPWLIIALASLIVLGGAAAGAWYLLGGSHAKGKAPKPAAPTGPPIYVALDPAFVTNFEADQAVRFLQVNVQVLTHDPATADLIKANDPVVRNNLLLLFSNQKYADIATREGKERLRAQALTAVRGVVSTAGGKADHVEAVYFTSFVMQ